jgi:hypothetical protein
MFPNANKNSTYLNPGRELPSADQGPRTGDETLRLTWAGPAIYKGRQLLLSLIFSRALSVLLGRGSIVVSGATVFVGGSLGVQRRHRGFPRARSCMSAILSWIRAASS